MNTLQISFAFFPLVMFNLNDHKLARSPVRQMILFILIVAIFLFMFIFYGYKLFRLQKAIQDAWNGVEKKLIKRQELIPQLVEIASPYMQREENLFSEMKLAQEQSALFRTVPERAKAEEALHEVLKKFFLQVEQFPQLKADPRFRKIQDKLVEIEDGIQLAGRFYNTRIREYNQLCETFPAMWVAKLLNFKPLLFFEITEAERAVPRSLF